jgi:TolB-like protein/Tfp pilus assembly protein PilF
MAAQTFLTELKRRNVIRMAGVYLVGAWLVVQVSSTLLPVFDAPTWVMKTVVAILGLGFLPALLVSWAFELTPDGLKREGAVDPARSIAPQTARTMDRVIIAGLALVILAMAIERLWFVPAATAPPPAAAHLDATPPDSIAVLPFRIRAENEEAEYLSDGLTESLIFRLAQVPGLRVRPSSSVFAYRRKQVDPVQLAKELGVRAIVSGRVAQRGDDLDISVEMIDARTGTLLWGNQYRRKMAELLAIQREIVLAIAGKLRVDPAAPAAGGLTKRFTNSSEAYRLFLQGRYFMAKRRKADLLQGIDYLRQATAADPGFALAFASIAEAYTIMPSHAYLSPREAIPQATVAARQAIAIDPALADAHMVLANIAAGYGWDWALAEREFKASFALNPNVSTAHLRYGQFLAGQGQVPQAIAQFEQALALEPQSLNASANLALVHLYAGHNKQGLDLAKSAHELEPGFATGRFVLGIAYNSNGMHEDAIRLSESILASEPDNQLMLMNAGYAYARSGRPAEAQRILGRFRKLAQSQYVVSYCLAVIHAGQGDKDAAFRELDRSFEQREWWLTRLKVDPLMDSLRDDRRFGAMLKRLGIPE